MIFKIFLRPRKRRPKASGERIERWRAEAKASLVPRTRELAAEHGLAPNRIFIKNNRSNWGSCSVKGNINLNLQLMGIPEHLRDYVILHELCHLAYPNHGREFHVLLQSLLDAHGMGSEKVLRSELRGYHTI